MSAKQPLIVGLPAQTGAALNWIAKEYGGLIQVNANTVINVNSVYKVIVPNNADRLALILSNVGGNDLFVEPQGFNIGQNNGIILTANGGFISMNVKDDMVLPTFEWGTLTNQSSTILFVEVLSIVPRIGGV